VDVSLDGGAYEEKKVLGFTGNGQLSATANRATINGLIVVKGVADTTSKKVFINVDDVEIISTAAVEPVRVVSPILDSMSSVTVQDIDSSASLVKLYKNGSPIASAGPGGASQHVFSG